MNISRPYQSSIFLRACPCTPKKIYNFFLSFFSHTIKEGFRIHNWIYISNLYIWSQMITIVFKIVNRIFWFCFIQPENFNSFVIIIFLSFFPYIFSCFWICRVILNGISHVCIINADPLFHSG